MSRLTRLTGGFMALLSRRQLEQDLDDELDAYLETAVEQKMRGGMAREEAVRAARAELGSFDAVKEYTREAGWEGQLDSVWRDTRHAAAALRRSPAFTAVAVLTLALGIGANTAIFSVINAVMLRPLPVGRPDELIALAALQADSVEPFSYAAYRQFAEEGSAVVDAIATSTVRRDAVAIDGMPEPIDLKWVSGNFFTTLGVGAETGRTLLRSDDRQPPGEAVAVLSYAYWTRRFGRDPSVLGRAFTLRGATFTIVGIAPRGFSGETVGEALDAWVPIAAQPGTPAWVWSGHSTTWLSVLARRQPGVTLAQARARLEPVYDRIRADIAGGAEDAKYRRQVAESRLLVTEASGGLSRLRDNLSTPLVILMGIVGLVLVVACANVANLMLARAASQRRETAVRLAIGAGRLRVVRHGLMEALLIAVLGGAGGLLMASWGGAVLVSLVAGATPVSLEVSPDLRVLAFTALISCATAVGFGLLPALRLSRVDPLSALKAGGSHGSGSVRILLRRSLVVAQIVVSLVLLVTSALFVRSLARLQDIEMGFDPDRVLLFRVAPAASNQPVANEERRQLYRSLLDRAERVPGVEAASASFSGVFSRETWGNSIAVEGVQPPTGETLRTFANAITPRYFDVMRIAVRRGRGFGLQDDENGTKVAVVNETFARRFFGTADPIGKRVAFCTSDPCGALTPASMEIVGVTEDSKHVDLRESPRPLLYVPFTQRDQRLTELEVRTAGDPAAMASTLHRALAGVDSRVAIVAVVEARERVAASIMAERLIAKLSMVFGLLALAVAGVGVYGVIAYVTSQRTAEIGIRMALGADRREIRRLVLRDTLVLVGIGVLIGIPAALAAGRLVASLLYEVAPADPLAVSLALVTLAAVALCAGYLPAVRATRIDPLVALRVD